MLDFLLPSLLATTAEPGGVVGYLVDLMDRLGGPGAAIAIALENVFPPIPSELFLPLAGFSASHEDSRMSLHGAIIWTTFGSVVGALALYGAGALFGRDRTRRLAERVPLVKVEDFDRTEAWFAKHGTKAVFFGRMLPIFRSLISIPAGVERMPLLTFVTLTALGSAIWNSLLIGAGYQLGERWTLVERYTGAFTLIVILASAVVALMFVTKRLRERREGEL
ncbi:MAG: DedA family protein [Solirubrobacterales bacterium]